MREEFDVTGREGSKAAGRAAAAAAALPGRDVPAAGGARGGGAGLHTAVSRWYVRAQHTSVTG